MSKEDEEKEIFEIEFSPSAEKNLEQIEDYIVENKNAEVAAEVVDRILVRCNALRLMPRVGQNREEIGSGIRSVSSGNYVIYYRIHGRKVEVLRVWHGARDHLFLRSEL